MNENNKIQTHFLQNQIIEPLNRQSIKGLFTFYREQEQIEQLAKLQKYEEKQMKKIDKLRKQKSKMKINNEDPPEGKTSGKKSRPKKHQLSQTKLQENQEKTKRRKKNKLRKSQLQKKQTQLDTKLVQTSSKTLPIRIQPFEDVADKFLKRIKQRKLTKSINLKPQKQLEITQANFCDIVQSNKHKNNNINFYKLLYPKENQKKMHDQKYENEEIGKGKLCYSVDIKKRIKNILQIQKNQKNRKMLIQEIIQKHACSLKNKRPKARKRLYTQIPSNILSQINHQLDKKLYVRNNFYTNQHNNKQQQDQQDQDIDQINSISLQKQQCNPFSPPSMRHEAKQKQPFREDRAQKSNQNQLKFPKIKNTKLDHNFPKVKSVSSSKQKILRSYDHSRCKRCEQKILAQAPKRQKSARNKTEAMNQYRNQLAFIQLGIHDTRDFHHNNSLWQNRKNLLLKKLGIKI